MSQMPSMGDKGEKSGEGFLQSMKVSGSQLQMYLKGIDYPVRKQQLIEVARRNNAPEMVMSLLNRLPEREYKAPTEVEQEFGKMK